MTGEMVEEKSELRRQTLIDARFFVPAVAQPHRESATAREVHEIQLTMACIVDLYPCGSGIVEDHARVAR